MSSNDTKIIITAVDQASSAIGSIGASVDGLGAQFSRLSGFASSFAAIAGVGMFGSLIAGAVNAAGELDDMAKKTGASVESLSALKNASKSAGVDLETVGRGLSKLSRNMLEASDGTSTASKMFADLGVSIKNSDGSLRDSNAVMLDAAKGIAGLQSGTERAAAAQVLFGKSGADMVPLLLDIAEKTELVGTVTAEQAAMSDRFGDNLIALQQDASNAFQTIANAAIPVLLAFSETMVEANGGLDGMRQKSGELAADGSIKSFAETAGRGAAFIADAFGAVIRIFQATGTSLGALAAGAATIWETWKSSGILTVGEFTSRMGAALDRAKEINRQSKEDIQAIWMKETFSDIFARQMTEIDAAAATGGKKAGNSLAAGFVDGIDKTKKKAQELIDVFKNGSFITKNKETAKFIADQYKASNEMAKELNDEEQKRIETSQKVADKNGEIVTGLKAELDGLSLGSREREISLALSRLTVDATQEQVDAVRQLAGALHDSKEATDAQNAASKAASDEWKSMWSSVEKTGHDVFVNLFSEGKSAFEGIGKALKASVIDLLYQMTVKKWIISIGASLSGGGMSGMVGATGMDGSGGAMGMAGNAYSLYNAGSGVLGNTFSALGTGATSIGGILGATGAEVMAASTYGTAIGSTTTAMLAAQEAGMGAAGAIGSLGTALAAVPVWGWAAMGALALFGMSDSGGAPKVNINTLFTGGSDGIDQLKSEGGGESLSSAIYNDAVSAIVDKYASGTEYTSYLGGHINVEGNSSNQNFAYVNTLGRSLNSVNETGSGVIYNNQNPSFGKGTEDWQKWAEKEIPRMQLAIVTDALRTAGDEVKTIADMTMGTASDLTDTINMLDDEGVTEKLNQMMDGLTILSYVDAQPIEDYAAAAEQASRTLMDAWRDSGAALNDLIATYDGGADATKTLAAATQSQYQLELQLIGQIQSALASTQGMFGNSIESIKLSVMDEGDKYDYYRSQADAIYQQLATATDPAQIQGLAEQINQYTNQAYGLLDSEQQQGAAGGFIDYLTQVDELTTQRLNEQQDTVIATHDAVADAITTSMDAAATAMAEKVAAAVAAALAIPQPPIQVTVSAPAGSEVSVMGG